MEPAAEREGPPSQWLTHPSGQSIDYSYVRPHRTQLAAPSQRCRQDDKIVVITQFGLQTMEVGYERRNPGHQRPCQTQLIPESLQLFSPAMHRCGLSGFTSVLHRFPAPAIRVADDLDQFGHPE